MTKKKLCIDHRSVVSNWEAPVHYCRLWRYEGKTHGILKKASIQSMFVWKALSGFYPKESCSSSQALTKRRKVMIKNTVTFWVSELMTEQQKYWLKKVHFLYFILASSPSCPQPLKAYLSKHLDQIGFCVKNVSWLDLWVYARGEK